MTSKFWYCVFLICYVMAIVLLTMLLYRAMSIQSMGLLTFTGVLITLLVAFIFVYFNNAYYYLSSREKDTVQLINLFGRHEVSQADIVSVERLLILKNIIRMKILTRTFYFYQGISRNDNFLNGQFKESKILPQTKDRKELDSDYWSRAKLSFIGLFAMTVFVFTIIVWGINDFKNSEAYQTAVYYVKSNGEVLSATGGVKRIGYWLDFERKDESCEMEFKVVGEKRRINVKIVVVKVGNEWTVKDLEIL